MDPDGLSIERMKLRAHDMSERTARRGRESAQERLERLRGRSFMILQCAVTAGASWWLAAEVLNHPTPFFAPVAAIICLGFTFGQRLRRGIEVAIGVALGVLVGDVFVTFFGTGVWQIIIVCGLAMCLATLIGAGNLMTIQAGVQSIIVISFAPRPDQALDRWLDAVVGCALALAMATIAPSAPLRRPRLLAAALMQEMARTLSAAEDALRRGDQEAADAVLDQARRGERDLAALEEAVKEGLAVVRYSPFRRSQVSSVESYGGLYEPLDRANRNLRVLARRCAVSLWRRQTVPSSYLAMMAALAETAQFMGNELYDGRLPTAGRERLLELGRQSSHLVLNENLSAVVILAQLRSIVTDLLELTGLSYAEARAAIPDMD
ncbi:MAG: hypothetical protein AVDCRST_MAG75-2712 [uncultured Propionibacteriaceae bacterium]|uniref:Integral membrane bound transporter domain-containing protein n=1 Tax=uncultured Propionibacteriaceae bacterium TaxID=257457 RepID=A0A6J4PA39_9ACTN|nr:MAG: hypothetical protein AVDCRST_MAG75-2712 [uncultured Propionibacteriaceae bacterium]